MRSAGIIAAGSGQLKDLPEYCRVEGVIAPRITFELRLPTATWNGKFLMQGSGGMCGIINIETTEDSLIKGYAGVNTDMGHTGHGCVAVFAYNDRQSEIDFAYRAAYVTAVAAKAITKDFCGKVPSRLMLTETLYNAQSPYLRFFKSLGAKAIMYQGWDDMEIPPGLSVDY